MCASILMSQIKFISIEALSTEARGYLLFKNLWIGSLKKVVLLFQLLPVDPSNDELMLAQKIKIQRGVILTVCAILSGLISNA